MGEIGQIVVVCAALLAVGWWWPEVVVAIFINGLFVARLWLTGTDIPYFSSGIVLLIAVGVTLRAVLRERRDLRSLLVGQRLLLLGPMALAALAVAWLPLSGAPEYGVEKALMFGGFAIAPMLLVTLLAADRKRATRLVAAIGWIGVVYALLAFVPVIRTGDFVVRGTIGIDGQNPIWFARRVALGILCLVVPALVVGKWRTLGIMLGLSTLLLYVLVQANSLGPLVSLILTLWAVVAWYGLTRVGWRALIPAVALPFLLLAAVQVVAPELVRETVGLAMLPDFWLRPGTEAYEDGLALISRNAFVRRDLIMASLAALREHWLVGVGTGGFLTLGAGQGSITFGYPHNVILEIWVEWGLLGLALFLAWMGAVTASAVRQLRDARRDDAWYPLTLTGAAVFLFGFLNALASGDLPGNGMIWVGAGLLAATATARKKADDR